MKRGIILILLLVLFSSISLALDVQIDAIQYHVLKGQNAVFKVSINNDAFEDKLFTVKSIDLNWVLQNSPVVENVPNKGKKEFEIIFNPLGDLKPSNYGVNLVMNSDKGDRIERFLQIKLLDNQEILDVELTSPGPLDIKKTNTLTFRVKNKFEVFFDSLDIKLTSQFLDKEYNFALDKKGEHVEDIILDLDQSLESGDYPFRIFIKYKDEVLVDQEINIEIKEHTKLSEISDIQEGFLTKKEIIRKINDGNSVVQEIYTREFSLSERLFTFMTPSPDNVIKIDGYYKLSWNLKVEPGEETKIILYKNYRDPLIILLIAVLILYFVYRWKIKTVRVKKKVMTMHTDNKEYITNMKVLISVKNRGVRKVNKIKVRERIPNLTHPPKDFGSLKPISIRKISNGMELIWDIDKLQIGEERLLSYRVENKLHILGKLILPPSVVIYEDKNKKEIVHSNKIKINIKNQ